MDAKAIAEAIREQLGRGFCLMVGAGNFSYDTTGALSFRFKGCKKFNSCTIALNPYDTYDVTFRKVSVRGEARREEHEGIYFDGLHDLFRRVTGLETRVPRIVGA